MNMGIILNYIRKITMSNSIFALILSLVCLQSTQVSAEGLRIYGLSEEARARGEAVTASVSDASAIWYNPGALTNLGKMDIALSLNNAYIPAQYTNLAGRTERNGQSYFPIPAAYVSSNLGTEKWAVGIGVNSPWGLKTEYSGTSSFRYITTGGEVELTNINPTVAYKVNSSLSIGVGLNYFYSTAKLSQQYSWNVAAAALSIPGVFADGTSSVEGTGDGLGFNVGLLYKINEQHSIGATYRSQVVVEYSHRQAELTNIPAIIQASGIFPAGTGSKFATGSRTSIRYPDMVALGYAFRPTERLVWEIGGHWTNYNDTSELQIDLEQPNALFPNTRTDFDWKNSFAIKTGIEHQCNDSLSLAAGYFYNKSPTNEATFSPLIPDGDHHVFSIGVKYKLRNWTFRLPIAGLIQTGTGSIDSNSTDTSGLQNADGDYDAHMIQVGIGIGYSF